MQRTAFARENRYSHSALGGGAAPSPQPPSRFFDLNSSLHTCEYTSLHTHIYLYFDIFCIYSCESIEFYVHPRNYSYFHVRAVSLHEP